MFDLQSAPLTSIDSDSSEPTAPLVIGIIVGCVILIPIAVAIVYYWYDKEREIENLDEDQAGEYNEILHPEFPIVSNWQIEGETMKQFLSNISRMRPLRFSPEQLAKFTINFSEVLGSGGFGVVYKGEFSNGVQIAVKVLVHGLNNTIAKQFIAEIGTIGMTYHINLVRLYGFCFHNTMRALVYEYMDFGSLDKLLFTDLKYSIDFKKLHEIAMETAKGIAYLHEECQKRIIHYDIKPENVLLDKNLKPKVADFGLAMLCNQDSSHVVLSGYRGTPGYAAPEMWTPYPVTHKCDVYSFGMLLFEIVGRRRNHDPNLNNSSKEWLPKWTYKKFTKGELLDMLTMFNIQDEEREKAKRMVMVALWCIQNLPNARPMMSTVVKMLEGGVEVCTPPNPFEHLEDLILELSSLDSFKESISIESGNKSLAPHLEWNHLRNSPDYNRWNLKESVEKLAINTI